MATYLSVSAPSSPATTEYLSFPEEDSDHEQALRPAVLKSTSAVALRTESPSTRALLCINATRILLLETQSMGYRGSLEPLKRERVLHGILSIGSLWSALNIGEIETANDIFNLPLFSSSIELMRRETQPCSLECIGSLVKQLQRMAACAVLDGDNDTIACIGLPAKRNEPRTTFIVFNPRCRSSPDLTGASLRVFPTLQDTVNHISSLFSIYKSAVPDGPKAMYNAHVLRLVDPVTLKKNDMPSTYQVNMHLLQETRRLEVIAAKEGEARREMNQLIKRIEAVEDECRVAHFRRKTYSEDISRLRTQLEDVQAMTAAMLGDVLPSRQRWETEDVEMEDLTQNQRNHWNDMASSKSPPRSFTTTSSASTRHRFKSDSSDSGRGRRTSTPGTPPDTLWNTEREALRLKEQQRKDEEAQREAQRLRALQEEEEQSLQYARQLAMEEENEIMEFEALKEANRSFDCPICAEEYHVGFIIRVDRCNHEVCRECVLNHVRTQVEEAHWPIFCPMCPGNLEKRGVITRHLAELVGGDEKLFEAWNRMELGGVSIALECPKCKESTRVDSEDFREAEFLDCPLGCGAHWCKDCHQEVERGKKHSCDGQAEFDELAKTQNWRACPGCGAMAEKISGCNQLSCRVPGCNSHFCYICGGMIAKTTSMAEMGAAKSRHYQTCKLF